jgi:entericidin B
MSVGLRWLIELQEASLGTARPPRRSILRQPRGKTLCSAAPTTMERTEMKPRNMKSAVVLAIALASTLAVSACNTMEGVGKDVKSGGSAIEDTAKDAKN